LLFRHDAICYKSGKPFLTVLYDANKKFTKTFEKNIEMCTEIFYYVNCLNDEAYQIASFCAGEGDRTPVGLQNQMIGYVTMRRGNCEAPVS
jgi:hypothetical protein